MVRLGEIYTATIEETNIFANGVTHIDSVAVFVENALEGEVCELEITKVMPRYAFAKCTKIITPSRERQAPGCQAYNKCGGCTFLHTSIAEENKIKTNYVRSTLKKQGIEATVNDIVTLNSDSYRNKVVLFFDGEGFGYMKEGTNEIVKHQNCLLYDITFSKIAEFTAKKLKNTTLRALYLRKSSHITPQIMVCPIFLTPTGIDSYIKELNSLFPNVKSVFTSTYSEKELVLEKCDLKLAYGEEYIYDTLCDISFRVSPEAFFQINHECASALYQKAIELADLDENTICADLFCGTGTIGIISAKKTGATVYGIEIVKRAVEDAEFNAKSNNIRNITFKATDAKNFNKEVDVCIVDPPRKGLSSLMLDTLKRLLPSKIVYISCNADTLARDLKSLSQSYTICSPIHPYNMFPRTSHVESVVCLKRRLDVDMRR